VLYVIAVVVVADAAVLIVTVVLVAASFSFYSVSPMSFLTNLQYSFGVYKQKQKT